MDITIEIDNTSVNERQINTDRGPFKVRDQVGWLQLPGKKYPQEIVLSLDDDQAPFALGSYRVKDESVTIDKYKRIAFQRSLELEPVADAS